MQNGQYLSLIDCVKNIFFGVSTDKLDLGGVLRIFRLKSQAESQALSQLGNDAIKQKNFAIVDRFLRKKKYFNIFYFSQVALIEPEPVSRVPDRGPRRLERED